MQIAGHVHKVKKLDQLRARLAPLEDFELWFWATMMAGTHAVNAALHRAGVTLAVESWPTQPHVYQATRADGQLVTAFGPMGDVVHVGRPVIEATVPEDVHQMMHAMERIEEYRDPCVREGRKPTQEIVDTCSTAFSEVLALLDRRLSESH